MIHTPSNIGKTAHEVDVAIVGGGIGGLAAAVALRHAGIDAHVFERTEALAEVGGAVIVREPSANLFETWGVAERFYAESVRVDDIDIRRPDGTHVRSVSVDRAGEGQSYSVHRADVHASLLAAIPADRVHLAKTCTRAFEEDGRGVATFADGTGVRARVLVGADGIKSQIRRLVSADAMKFAGLVVLRGLAPASALPAGLPNDRIYMWGEEPRMMVLLPLRRGEYVAMDTVIAQERPPENLWTTEVPTRELLDVFAGFDPALLDLIRAGTVPVRANPVYEREPIERWSAGPITLLGDAAHPMAPRMGQGANTAIADAGALAKILAELGLDDATEALRRYERERTGPTAKMQLASRVTQSTEAVAR